MSDDYDFSDVMAGLDEYQLGTKLHDKGDYNFRVVSAEPGETSNKNPKIALKLEFLDGAFRGHTANKDVIFSPTKPGFFWKQLGWLGVDYGWAKENGQTRMSQLCLLVTGAQFKGEMNHREWPENSGNFSESVDIRSGISNPNVGSGAKALNGSGARQGGGNSLPPLQEDTPAVPAAVDAATDDPWGSA